MPRSWPSSCENYAKKRASYLSNFTKTSIPIAQFLPPNCGCFFLPSWKEMLWDDEFILLYGKYSQDRALCGSFSLSISFPTWMIMISGEKFWERTIFLLVSIKWCIGLSQIYGIPPNHTASLHTQRNPLGSTYLRMFDKLKTTNLLHMIVIQISTTC